MTRERKSRLSGPASKAPQATFENLTRAHRLTFVYGITPTHPYALMPRVFAAGPR